MSRLHRAINLVAVVVPFLCFIAALVLLWNSLVGWVELTVLVLMYVLTGLGITIGFHRLFTHRSFDTYRPIRYLFAVLGSMAVEGPVITWVADHRKHHAFADEDGDPHSPHTTHGVGPLATIKGLWHAHVGWMFSAVGRADRMRYAPDLMKDRVLRAISAGFLPLFFLSLALPFALGWLIGGTVHDGCWCCCGAARCASSCSTTSPGASTRSATSSAAAASPPRTTRPTSPGSRSSRSASRGTTTTTPSRPRPATACAGGSWPSIRAGS